MNKLWDSYMTMLNLYNKKYVYLEWDDILEGKKCILADDIDTLKNYVNYDCELRDVQKEIKHEYYGKYFTTKENDFDVVYRFAYYDPNLEVKRALINGKSVQYYSEFGKWTDLRLWGSIENYLDMEDWDEREWRVKPKYNLDNIYSNYQPTEPKCYLSVNKNGYLEFTISLNMTNDTIYNGTRKECERMMKIIADEFEEEVFSHWDTPRLRYIIDKYSHEKYKRRMTNRELSEYLAKGNGEMKKLGYLINTSTSHCYKNNAENENVNDDILIRDFGSDEWRSPLIEV